MTRRIVVTGGSGFIGRYVCEKLKEEGYDAVSFDRVLSPRMEGTSFELVRDYFAEMRPQFVINLMALCGSRGRGGSEESRKDPAGYFRENCLSCLNVFESARLLGLSGVIQMSSFSVYGNSVRSPIDESTRMAPTDPYGASKMCCEVIADTYARRYGLKAIIARAPLVVGKGQIELNAIREFIKRAIEGRPIEVYGNGIHRREWLHPTDMADAIVRMIKYLERMQEALAIFILGSVKNRISMKDLARKVIDKLGKGEIVYIPERSFDQITGETTTKQALEWESKVPVDNILDELIREEARSRADLDYERSSRQS